MRQVWIPISLFAVCVGGFVAQHSVTAQGASRGIGFVETADEAREALDIARTQAQTARARVAQFEQQARDAEDAADQARARVAAMAARIQQAEAGIGMAEAQLALVQGQTRMLNRELADRREPIVRLTGALQMLVRRPVSLSLLRPGSVRDTVYLGAILDSSIPIVRDRTAALRGDLERVEQLQGEALDLIAERRETEADLQKQRRELQAVSRQQRLASQDAAGAANREEMLALSLAEEARDLDGLVGQLERAGGLRAELAALPGPILRPANPNVATVGATAQTPDEPEVEALLAPYRLPVDGRITAGFGELREGGTRGSGLDIVARSEAQIIAPAAGRIAFAGPFRGFSQIVIIEHSGGWTSLITGLGDLSAEVGERVVEGSPIGQASRESPLITLEVRRDGTPINPLELIAS